jgi:hypothetical protein
MKLPEITARLLTATNTPINVVVDAAVTARDLTKKNTAEPDTIELAKVVKNTTANSNR